MSTFNSKQYAFHEASFAIDGVIAPGITGLKYNGKRNMETIHASGSEPYAIQDGPKSYDGTVSMLQSLYDQLVEISPNKDLTLLESDITQVYSRVTGGKLQSKTLQCVRFMEMPEGMEVGDTHMKISIPIMFLGLKS